jgi:hypothetical protein
VTQTHGDSKVRSFTHLLRRASSRGSHNTLGQEENKDEPVVKQLIPFGQEIHELGKWQQSQTSRNFMRQLP